MGGGARGWYPHQGLPHWVVVRGTGSWVLKRSTDLECSWVHVIAVVNRIDSSNSDSIARLELGTAWAWPGARAGGG